MHTHFRVVSLFIALFMILTACTMSIGVEPPAAPSSDQVATVVAETLQAGTPVASAMTLPSSLYFLGKDNQSLTQVFRMKRDGETQSQLTSESVDVLDHDVSPLNGSFVYEIDNQLILVNADGSDRRVLQQGELRGNVRGWYRPVFSPDGEMIAYAHEGLTLYNVASGKSELVIPDQSGDDGQLWESYVPEKFSPDGKKLLIHMLHSDTSSIAIYDLAVNSLVRFQGKSDDDFACCQFGREIVWSPDSSSFYAANPSPGVDAGGMWRVDAATGEVTMLVPYSGADNRFNFVDEPYAASDGQLYYFYSTYNGDLGPVHRAPEYLEIVRSAADGVTGRTNLFRSEDLRMMNEALWAPDASSVVVVLAPSDDVQDGGQAEIVSFDGKPNVVLATFAQKLRWGP
jgi:hypothetical protein